jgi:hypothetical protein
MTLSFNKLNEIAGLYESIAASEQEQLDEYAGSSTGSTKSFSDPLGKAASSVRNAASSVGNSVKKTIYPTIKKQSPGSGYAGGNITGSTPASAARTTPAATPTAKVAPTKPAAAPASAARTTPAATPTAKVAPTKPAAPAKPAMGTTAGGTKFERRAATGEELRAAQAARAAAKASGNTKGAEEAAVKAGVAAGKSTLKQSFEYDAYDLVLEYLLSQGHAETVAEAQYLMTEMDAEMIGDIVEGGTGAFVPSRVDDFNNRRDMLKNRYGQDVSPRIPGPSGGGQFEKPSSNPAGALRLAKTSSKGGTKTA